MINAIKEKLQKWIIWFGVISTLLTFGGIITSKFTKVYRQIKENRGFSEVLCGLLIADLHPIDSLDYIVKLDGHKTNVKLRKAAGSENIYVFVLNENMMVYFAAWNDSEKKYSSLNHRIWLLFLYIHKFFS